MKAATGLADELRDRKAAGGCAHSAAACFSFHPVKTIACGEGGGGGRLFLRLGQESRRSRRARPAGSAGPGVQGLIFPRYRVAI